MIRSALLLARVSDTSLGERNDLTKRFPELPAIQIKAESAIVDGEITALDEEGLPCFDQLNSAVLRVSETYKAFRYCRANVSDEAFFVPARPQQEYLYQGA